MTACLLSKHKLVRLGAYPRSVRVRTEIKTYGGRGSFVRQLRVFHDESKHPPVSVRAAF